MSNKKKIAKFLREEGKKLPPEEYSAYHRYFKMEYHKDGDQAYPVYGEVGKHQVNHGRRLKKLYQKHGKAGVDQYFKERGYMLIPKGQDSPTSVSQEPGGLGNSKDSPPQYV